MGTSLTGALKTGWVWKIAIFYRYLALLRVVNAVTVACYQQAATGLWQVGDMVTPIAGSKNRQSLLIAGDVTTKCLWQEWRVLNITQRQQNNIYKYVTYWIVQFWMIFNDL